MAQTTIQDACTSTPAKTALVSAQGMNNEYLRIGSYSKWPLRNTSINCLSLARAGFYYCGDAENSDAIACFRCTKTIRHWVGRKDPVEEHRRSSPSCGAGTSYVSNSLPNIPLKLERNLTPRQAYSRLTERQLSAEYAASKEETASVACEFEKNSEQSENLSHLPNCEMAQSTAPSSRSHSQTCSNGLSNTSSGEHKCVNIQQIVSKIPKTHKVGHQVFGPTSTDPRKRGDIAFMDSMRSEKERRKTFYDWPEGAWQTPAALAAAGFFYTGSADRCQCAFCRGILRNWEPNDIPIVEHSSHYSECPFVQGRDVGNIPVQAGISESKDTKYRSTKTTTQAPLTLVSKNKLANLLM